jgi:hypothetical protein
MTEGINPGVYGAKQQSYYSQSPRAVLVRALEEFPDKPESEIFDVVLRRLQTDEDLMEAVVKYWFANELNNVRRRAATPAEKIQRQAQVRAVSDQIIDRINERVRIILSEMVMPSGTRLRDSTREECASAGGWFTKLAAGMQDDQRVGDVFGEDQLRNIYLG